MVDGDEGRGRDDEAVRGGIDRTAGTVDLGGGPGVRETVFELDQEPSDRYLLEGELGEGGMAVVHRARDLRLERPVAVKRLRPELEGHGTALERFLNEARILANLDHPGVVPVFDLGRLPDGGPFYAMKRVQGATLRQQLDARSREQVASRSSLEHFVDLYERVCRTVAAAHRDGVIHRDLKPENIMVDGRGEVYVMDWGLAKRLAPASASDEAGRTRFGAVLGTPAYMAPEQVRGEAREAGRGADVFALGVLLYEILTGRNPFASDDGARSMEGVLHHQPEPPRRSNPRVPRPLAAVCMKALDKDPFRRYADACELAEEIRRYRELLPVSAHRPGLTERATAWSRRHRVTTGVLATVAVMVTLAAAWGAVQRSVEHALVARAYERMDRAREEATRLEAELATAQAQLARASAPDERERLEAEVVHLRARREAQLRFAHSLAVGVIGFTLFSPEGRAERLLKTELMGTIEEELRSGSPERAEVLIRFALLTAQGANALKLDPEEKALLERRLAVLEQLPPPRPNAVPSPP